MALFQALRQLTQHLSVAQSVYSSTPLLQACKPLHPNLCTRGGLAWPGQETLAGAGAAAVAAPYLGISFCTGVTEFDPVDEY